MKIAVFEDEKKWEKKIIDLVDKSLKARNMEYSIETYERYSNFAGFSNSYDIIFVDIELPDCSGLDICKEYLDTKKNGIAIIISCHEEMSREGYKVNAFRYIDKFYIDEEFSEAIDRAVKILEKHEKITLNVVKLGEIEIYLDDILYIETEKRNIDVHTTFGNYKCSNSITSVYKQLENKGFYMITRSDMINLDKINYISDGCVKIKNGDKICVSEKRYSELKKRYIDRICER